MKNYLTRVREPFTGETFNEISIYAFDQPVTIKEASLLIAEAAELFNIAELKTKFMLMRVLKKGWSKRQLEEAIENAFDKNKIPTKNVGMEPGVILSYEKKIKLYTYHDSIGKNLNHVNIRGLEGHWWVDGMTHILLKEIGAIKKSP